MNFIIATLLGFSIQLLIHEIGHLIGGLLSGWKLLYIQLFHWVVVKEGKKIRLRIASVKDFQCIMYPKNIHSDALLYTAGGCISNFILINVALVIMIIGHKNPVEWFYGWSIFVFGIAFLIANGIPRTVRICNDMACFLLLLQDEITARYHNAQFFILRGLYEGMTYKNISEELICLSTEKADNDLLAYHAVLEFYYYCDQEKYDRAEQALNKIICSDAVSRNVKDIVAMEKVYLKLLTALLGKTSEQSVKLLEDAGKQILEHGLLGDIHTERVKSIYDLYNIYRSNENVITDTYIDQKVEHLKSTKNIVKGDTLFCINQLNKLHEILQRINT